MTKTMTSFGNHMTKTLFGNEKAIREVELPAPTPFFYTPPQPAPKAPQFVPPPPPSDVVDDKVKIDIGCGSSKVPGYTGVDICDIEGVDIVHDLEQYPWPFENESVDEIHCSHYAEHVSCLIKFMDESFRILKYGGTMFIRSPYYNSIRAWQDPTHRQEISEATFCYYNAAWRKENKLSHYKIVSDFDFQFGYEYAPEWTLRSDEAKSFAAKHWTNVVNDIYVRLVKSKR